MKHRDGGMCLWGLLVKDGCSGDGEVHHIIPRSVFRLDDPMNLITVCRKHHDQAEMRKITQTELFNCLIIFFKYDYKEFNIKYRKYIRT